MHTFSRGYAEVQQGLKFSRGYGRRIIKQAGSTDNDSTGPEHSTVVIVTLAYILHGT